jgi:hypothetical protein
MTVTRPWASAIAAKASYHPEADAHCRVNRRRPFLYEFSLGDRLRLPAAPLASPQTRPEDDFRQCVPLGRESLAAMHVLQPLWPCRVPPKIEQIPLFHEAERLHSLLTSASRQLAWFSLIESALICLFDLQCFRCANCATVLPCLEPS